MSEESRPLVSIVIPTYNRADLLLQAIQSVLTQTYEYFELLIVDDHSTDQTPHIVKNITDSRVHYIRLNKNQGAPAARNIGLKKAKGELIAFLDSDDQWDSTKLKKQVQIFNRNPAIGLVYTGLKILNNERNIETIVVPSKRGHITKYLLVQNCVGTTSSVLIKRDLLEDAGGFDLTFTSCQDWDLFIRLSLKTQFDYVREPLVIYYEHDGKRISTNSKSIINGYLKIHEKYNLLLKNLSKKEIQNHYVNIGKYILKAGILSQDMMIVKVGRSFLLKSVKIVPPQLKTILVLICSLNHKKVLLLLYRVFKKMKKKILID